MRKRWCCLLLLLLVVMASNSFALGQAEAPIPLSQGQTVYVPAYSHIYGGNRELPLLLTVTLSLRNVDPKHPITITSVAYYGSKGELIKRYGDQAVTLNPLESMRYVIAQRDKSGGSGANFLVEWQATKFVNPPLIEAIMIGAGGQQGISFTSRGQVITTTN